MRSGRLLMWLLLVMTLLLVVDARRGGKGRGKGRTKPGVSSGTGPGGLTDPNSRNEYYNNPGGARIIKSSFFDYEYILGHKVVFICEAKGKPRPQITWFKDGSELYAHPYMQIHEWKIDKDEIKSKMEIDPATQMDAGLYECHTNNKYAIDRRAFRADFSIGE